MEKLPDPSSPSTFPILYLFLAWLSSEELPVGTLYHMQGSEGQKKRERLHLVSDKDVFALESNF